jgi:mandelamide amidase
MTTVRNLQQASLVGMPSLSLPMPCAAGELPCGLCIEGLPGQDRLLLASAAAIEAALDGAGDAAQAGR